MKINRTVSRALDILEIISDSKQGYTLKELSDIMNAPKTSVFDIVKTLLYRNFIQEDLIDGQIKYKLGLKSFTVGYKYLDEIDLISLAKQELIDLANRMNATTFVAILNENMVTYLYKYESEGTIITTANIGSQRSVHSSALGKVMVANLDFEQQKQILDKTIFTKYTPYTIDNVEDYYSVLKEAKENDYAISDREDTLFQIAAAAPIRANDGRVIAAISCVGYYEEEMILSDLGLIVKETAKSISRKMGYIG